MHFFHKVLIKKALCIFLLICTHHLVLQAQTVDFNRVVPPEGQRPASFEDYLVQLAWRNNPETHILAYEKTKAEKEVDLQRTEWTDDLNFTFNINEVSLSNVLDPDPNNIILYPLYQFSAGISLGSFINNKKKREIEEVDVQIAEMEGNQHKLAIRAETLARYHKFLLAIETLKVRVKAEQDAENTYMLAQERFKNADLELQDLLQASESYNNLVEKRLNAETEITLTKLAIEEMIGVKWEVAKRYEERLGN